MQMTHVSTYREPGPLREATCWAQSRRSFTAVVVEGDTIEGHMPAREIRRLLAEPLDAIRLGVPGMPAGSPGMAFGAAVPYQSILFKKNGSTQVFAQYP